jgi:hypothetical protein
MNQIIPLTITIQIIIQQQHRFVQPYPPMMNQNDFPHDHRVNAKVPVGDVVGPNVSDGDCVRRRLPLLVDMMNWRICCVRGGTIKEGVLLLLLLLLVILFRKNGRGIIFFPGMGMEQEIEERGMYDIRGADGRRGGGERSGPNEKERRVIVHLKLGRRTTRKISSRNRISILGRIRKKIPL